jgi:hypothetical protein
MLPSRTCLYDTYACGSLTRSSPRTRIPDDTHDRALAQGEVDPPSDGINAWQVSLDEGLADHGDAVRLERVGLADVAAGAKRNAERFEEAWRHEPENRARVVAKFVDPAWRVEELDVPDASAHDHGQEADIGGARHAWQRPDVGQDARVEIDAARCRTVFRDRQRRLHRDHVRRVEARLD